MRCQIFLRTFAFRGECALFFIKDCADIAPFTITPDKMYPSSSSVKLPFMWYVPLACCFSSEYLFIILLLPFDRHANFFKRKTARLLNAGSSNMNGSLAVVPDSRCFSYYNDNLVKSFTALSRQRLFQKAQISSNCSWTLCEWPQWVISMYLTTVCPSRGLC